MIRYNRLIFVLLLIVSFTVSAQVRPRVAGLEGNEEYMSLLSKEVRFRAAEDSISGLIENVRKAFSGNDANRDSLGRIILGLEEQLFDARNNTGKVINSINSIEQRFVISSLGSGNASPVIASGKAASVEELLQVHLPKDDYDQLKTRRNEEAQLKSLADDYWINYGKMKFLVDVYSSVSEAAADSALTAFDSLKVLNRDIEKKFKAIWEPAFDVKLYAYSYILDYLREDKFLSEMEHKTNSVNEKIASQKERAESGVLSAYVLQDNLLLLYEKKLAEITGDALALNNADSKISANSGLAYDKPPVEITPRNFIEYEHIKITTPSIYNASNPIPREKVRVYGTVYKVDVGVFSRQQAISVFRGVSPITYDILDDGRYVYYVGALRTAAEAATAVETLKKAGFRRTEVVSWTNGKFENVDIQAEFYRIEISGMGDVIDPAVKRAIEKSAPGKEISKVIADDGKLLYIVGSFNSYELAGDTASAISGAAEVEVTIVTVSK